MKCDSLLAAVVETSGDRCRGAGRSTSEAGRSVPVGLSCPVAGAGRRMGDGLQWRWQAARQWLWQCATVTVYARELAKPVDLPLPSGLQIEPIRPDNLAMLEAAVGGRRLGIFRDHLAAGWRGAMGIVDGGAVNYHWARVGPTQATLLEPALRMDICEGQAYLLVEFTAPAWRGRRIAGAVRAWLMNRLFADGGVKTFLIAIDRRNGRNIRSVRRMGFVPLVCYRVLQVGPYRRVNCRRLGPASWGA